ncbi:Arc family DNA-binding protein [Pseudovibrio sp. SPO723]|uniref:Arc family DNA-binding protein n=1 Tax=Nesiotobacter zosterae TaxID=392721 RepID=UPI0029C3DDFA|nr:Arc family DNA-binding protein [Pseudovibrio sp. SPO723]MDX5592597.1 Arc family DNA-binding protein [Pseudovibrio sp. SPO723]
MTQHETPYFRLRVPEPLKVKIKQAAENEGRSMTAEIIQRLEQSFKHDYGEVDEAITDLYRQVDKLNRDLEKVISLSGLDGKV